MKNTTENKARFNAQYWGQKVFCIQYDNLPILYKNHFISETERDNYKESYLLLKPLSSITDEDALHISNNHFDVDKVTGKFIFNGNDGAIRYANNNIYFLVDYTITADYLRSKGYALPWMGLSVETLVEYGWIKLATS